MSSLPELDVFFFKMTAWVNPCSKFKVWMLSPILSSLRIEMPFAKPKICWLFINYQSYCNSSPRSAVCAGHQDELEQIWLLKLFIGPFTSTSPSSATFLCCSTLLSVKLSRQFRGAGLIPSPLMRACTGAEIIKAFMPVPHICDRFK